MSNLLAGKVAIVTGGGSGIGKAISEGLAKEGARVAVASRSASHLDAAAQSLKRLGSPFLALQADIRSKEQVRKAVERVAAAWGGVDILVNNAGVSGLNRMDDADDGRWYDILETNLTGTYLMTKEVLKVMRQRSGGRIINISSVLGKFGVPGYSAYCASKHGLIGFTKALALELVERGITVNAVCPGWVETAMARSGIEESAGFQGITPEEFKKRALQAVPIRRFLAAEEVAHLVCYLASPAAAGITGQALNVCGGQTMV
jgi:3-hydroxybutyrate dehydrogenase